MTSTSLPPILIVDDSLDDAFILSRLISKSGIRNPLQFVHDGNQAIDRLENVLRDPEFRAPLVMFTDLCMPKVDGFDLLRWIRSQTKLPRFPIVVVSGSDADAEVEAALDLGCHAFLHKYPTAHECHELCVAAQHYTGGSLNVTLPRRAGRLAKAG